MSAASSPSHRNAPNTFDGTTFYDPDFTVEISNRMRVPDKISVLPEEEMGSHGDQAERLTQGSKGKGSVDWMKVPDRIIVAGGDKHIAGRTPLPESKLESTMLGDDDLHLLSQTVQMMTPPRTISLNQHQYPSIDDDNRNNRGNHRSAPSSTRKSRGSEELLRSGLVLQDSSPPSDPYFNTSFNNTSVIVSDDKDPVRRQLRDLQRRVSSLERENRSRFSRELIWYTLGTVYLLMTWFRKPSWSRW